MAENDDFHADRCMTGRFGDVAMAENGVITGVFMHPAGDNLRIEFEDGEGGIYELSQTSLELEEVGDVPSEWIRMEPTKRLGW